jgi:methionyl-tRNA formyltransferase
MRIIYMGTPEFAVYALESLVKAGQEVVACFTQPDKAKGRSKALVATPVKAKAIEYNIPVYQPVKLREEENVNIIREYNPEVIVVAAYGQILPESILNIPVYGCVNIHASLLPKYRGAAPIEWSIIDGEKETGVTTMLMEKGLDTGDMLEQSPVVIEDTDTGETLHDKLAICGAQLILSTLEKLEKGTAVRTPQKDEDSCYASMLTKSMGQLDFTKDAKYLERLVRGLQPWPFVYTRIAGKNVKLYVAKVVQKPEGYKEGQVCSLSKKSFAVACREDALMITRLQPEGKKPMDTAAFLAGNKLELGAYLDK